MDEGYKFEAKKDAWKQLQSGDYKISLTINPDDIDMRFIKDPMGQRYVCVMVPIGCDEKPQGKSMATQAKMLSKDVQFQAYVAVTKGQKTCYGEGEAEQYIENYCGVKSCAEIVKGNVAGNRFKTLQTDFYSWRDRQGYEQ